MGVFFAMFIAITSILGSVVNGRYELAIMLPVKDEDAIINASDAEIETYMLTSGSFSINAGKRLKSSSENKHIIKQKYYIRETRNGETVAHALQDTVYITGSYSDNIADPTVQIIRTREIDMRILKG